MYAERQLSLVCKDTYDVSGTVFLPPFEQDPKTVAFVASCCTVSDEPGSDRRQAPCTRISFISNRGRAQATDAILSSSCQICFFSSVLIVIVTPLRPVYQLEKILPRSSI